MRPKSEGLVPAIIIALACLAILTGPLIAWYRAGVQADVYHRDGIQISQWEVFIGVHPAARAIDVHEEKK